MEPSERNCETLTEYPRRRLHNAEGEVSDAREVLTTVWELSEDNFAGIGKGIGPGAMQSPRHIVDYISKLSLT